MNDLLIIPTDLPELSVAQIARLPQEQLQELDHSLTALAAWTKQFRDRMSTALDQRYGETARSALVESGRDFGVTHFADGPLRISYELPKRVTWDQKRLSEIAERISASGERVQDYIDVELSVSETCFNGWPPVLKEQFAEARTVKAGKAKFVLELDKEDA